jgi:ectoine hydroxylase-related dioxygenase (phytanoyl-CoA dioxygenase family)
VYSLLTKTRACDHLIEHPRVLALLDRLLMPNYLLSQLQAIGIGPDETAQSLHFDDGMYPVPRPRAALSAATVWAISEFTADNSATVVISLAATAGTTPESPPTQTNTSGRRRGAWGTVDLTVFPA